MVGGTGRARHPIFPGLPGKPAAQHCLDHTLAPHFSTLSKPHFSTLLLLHPALLGTTLPDPNAVLNSARVQRRGEQVTCCKKMHFHIMYTYPSRDIVLEIVLVNWSIPCCRFVITCSTSKPAHCRLGTSVPPKSGVASPLRSATTNCGEETTQNVGKDKLTKIKTKMVTTIIANTTTCRRWRHHQK